MKNSTVVVVLIVFLLFVSGIWFLDYYQSDKLDNVIIDNNNNWNNVQESNNCHIESCHGLDDLKCVSWWPQMCDMMYKLWDNCRQYVSCNEVNWSCELEESEMFKKCKDCVNECNEGLEPDEVFECESRCYEEKITEEEAIEIAEKEWINFYWKKSIDEQRPLKAVLKDGNWIVTGTLPEGMVWWVMEVTISEEGGDIINITHWK